jgi:imidazolonepropionase-like amidohydrolase
VAPERTILDGVTFVTMELGGPRIDVTGRLVTPGLVSTHHPVGEHEFTQSAVLAHRTLLARASTVTSKEGTAS